MLIVLPATLTPKLPEIVVGLAPLLGIDVGLQLTVTAVGMGVDEGVGVGEAVGVGDGIGVGLGDGVGVGAGVIIVTCIGFAVMPMAVAVIVEVPVIGPAIS